MNSASATPAKTPSRFMCDATLIDSPLPQASSTVDRRNQDLVSMPQMSNLEGPPKEGHQSPAYLVHAINEMRELTDKLGIIPDDSQSVFKMPRPIPSDNPLRQSASIADFPEGRESIVTESEADSSLGILRLENEPGYSETEDMGKPSEVFAHLRRGHIQTNLSSSLESVPLPASKGNPHQISSKIDVKPTAGDKTSQFASFDNLSLPFIPASNPSRDMEADLRLRLQKALAQRTIDRSMDSSVRMSQLSDLMNDSISSAGSNGQPRPDQSQRMPEGLNFPSSSSFSPSDGGSFGADNFMSSLNKSQNPQDSLSSESFQPAEAAMARLEQDENSWRRQFGDLPIDLQPERPGENSIIKNSEQIQHLTQNLELSAFSGIVNGDVSLNLSQMEGSDKRRISMGEYFKLFSGKLGGEVEVDEDDEQRPNFGKVITSPTRKRPHPPLVNVSTSQVSPSSLDEVPTRDAGLNATIRSSILSFDLSAAAEMDASTSKDSPHTSRDLMPPPLAPVLHKRLSDSSISETVSSRLSTSLPLYKDADDCTNNDADISSFSMDRRWKASNVASISHIARYISEMPKSVSTRCLVDNLMKEFASDLPKDTSKQETAAVFSAVHNDNTAEQKVNEWMSSLRKDSYSIIDNDSSIDSDQQSLSHRFESSFKDFADTESSAFCDTDKHHVKSVCKPLNQGKMVVLSSGAFEEDTSDSPLSSMAKNPSTQGVRRSHSTPKLHSRVLPRLQARYGEGSKSDIENRQATYKAKDSLSRASVGSFTESRKGQQRSRSLNTQLGGGQQSIRPMSKESIKILSSSSQDSAKSVKPTENFQQSVKQENATKHRKSDSSKSPAESEAYSPSLVGSVCSGTKNSSRRTDATSVGSTPLQVDSTHTQLSWASVQLGSSVTQTFALRNRAPARTRLLVSSTHPAFKLMGERGESLSDLTMTLHPEETRRIHVIFTPSHSGPVVGKLIIRRASTSESSSSTSGDRRLIPLYAFGGVAELSIDGASKDRWSQLFLNMSVPDVDGQSEVSDADTTSDVQQMVAFFSVRNIGSVSAFVSLQVEPTELPFEDCGVYVSPTSILLTPGQCERVCVRFEPNHDVLLWLNDKAEDMQLLANLWLSWSELAVWQRIRRVFLKHCGKKEGSRLSKWGCLYTGDLGVANELRDKQHAETVLSQAVHRIKVAVLVEREKLNAFDLDTTLVFQQLIANESSMLISPPEAERASNAVCGRDSPLLAGNLHGLMKKQLLSKNQPAASHSPVENVCLSSDLIIYTNVIPQSEELCSVQFPKTLCEHKSSVKVRFLNPSSESCQVSAQGAVYPFTVSTADFNVQGGSYFVMRILFKPQTAGSFHCKLDIFVNKIKVRCYQLQGEGVGERNFLT